jgi:VWFA-related protein
MQNIPHTNRKIRTILKAMTAHECRHRSMASMVLFTAASLTGMVAQTVPSADSATQQVEAHSVVLNLSVRDRHNKLILDLRPDEVSITDNGSPVRLNGLHLVDPKNQNVPLIILLFDRPGMQDTQKSSEDAMFGKPPFAARESSKQLLDSATKFLKSLPDAGFQVAVMDVWGRLRIQQGFTTDRKVVARAVSEAVQPEVYGKRFSVTPDEEREIQLAQKGQDFSGSAADTRNRTLARSMYAAIQASSHIARDEHTSLSLACLLALAESLNDVPGRKVIVYFPLTSDDPVNWRSQDGRMIDTIHSIVGATNRVGASIYVVLPDKSNDIDRLNGLYRLNGLGIDLTQNGADIVSGGNLLMNSGTSTYAMTAVESLKPSAIAAQESLNMLARQTGGDVINANGRMAAPIKDLLQGLTAYYEASFPSSEVTDGSFHATVFKTSRHGLRMRAPTGYLAVPASAGIIEPPHPFELPLMALLRRKEFPSDFDYRAKVMRIGGQDGSDVSLLALEVPIVGLLVQEDASTHLNSARVSILATIVDASGIPIERFSEDIARRWATGQDRASAPEFISFQRSFSSPPGKYLLETAIVDNNGSKAAAKRQAFEVPPSQTGPAVSDLMLVRGTEPIDQSSNEPDLLWRGEERVFPNLYGQLPVGARKLSVFFFVRTDPAIPEPAKFHLEVLHEGTPIKGELVTSTLKPSTELVAVTEGFAINSAANGNYQLRVTLTQGGKAAQSIAEFSLSGEGQQTASNDSGAAPVEIEPVDLDANRHALGDPPPEELGRILADVRNNALEYRDRLPNLICQQTTTRLADPHGRGNWQLKDKIVEVLTYVDHQENRLVVSRELNHATKEEDTTSAVGMISSGEFGIALSNIFKPESNAVFTPKGSAILRGEPVTAFDYSIEKQNSSFSLVVPGNKITVPYHGRVYIDTATRGVRSLTMIVSDVPEKFPIRSTAIRVDYDYIAINDHDYLLPVSAQVIASQGKTVLERNDLQFSNFRKFGSKARVLTGDDQDEQH